MTKILLIYPPFPSTYWGLQYALRVLGKKAYMPPLGLITIAAMLPPECQVRLRDLNCESLADEDIAWADAVFISAMLNQKRSLLISPDAAAPLERRSSSAGRCQPGRPRNARRGAIRW